jgi:hypothetical protein
VLQVHLISKSDRTPSFIEPTWKAGRTVSISTKCCFFRSGSANNIRMRVRRSCGISTRYILMVHGLGSHGRTPALIFKYARLLIVHSSYSSENQAIYQDESSFFDSMKHWKTLLVPVLVTLYAEDRRKMKHGCRHDRQTGKVVILSCDESRPQEYYSASSLG